MNILKVIILFLILFLNTSVYGQITYPDSAISSIRSIIELVENGLKYTYTIENLDISAQVLSSFTIYINDSTLSNPPNYTADFYIVTPAPKKYYIDGVITPNAITGVAAGRFLELPPENGLSPGESLEFSFQTSGIPSINRFYSEGFVEPYTETLIDTLFKLGFTQEEIFYDWREKSYSKLTISPKLWSDSTTLDAFFDTLEPFPVRSCEELDWATDSTVCGQMETRLSEVKTSLVAEDSLSAANALKVFIDLVEAEKEASLTSEGYALLYFNAQYLAERLPEPETGSGITCGCDNPVTQTSGQIRFDRGETKCLSGTFKGSVFFQNAGTLQVCGTADFQNISGNQPGKVEVSETGNVTVKNWNNNNTKDALINWGTFEFDNQVTVNQGSLTNYETMTVGGGLNQNNGSLTNLGTLTVTRSVNLNQPNVTNLGTWEINGSLTLNSNAELVSSCQITVADRLMINGTFDMDAGAFTQVGGRMTISGQGNLSLSGANAMLSVNQARLNGSITSGNGINLITSTGNFDFNNSATIATGNEPLYMTAPNLSTLVDQFNVADGSQLVIPSAPCNSNGYNTNQ